MNERPHSSPMNESSPTSDESAVDVLCDEFARRIRAGEQPRIEDYLSQISERMRKFGFRHLLGVELESSRKAGRPLDADDLRRRFPDYRSLVDEEFRRAEQAAEVQSAGSTVTGVSRLPKTEEHVVGASAEQPPDDDSILERLGRFRITGVLGEGGFARVYLAEDTQLGRPVALKVPKKESFHSGYSIDTFFDEARVAAKLKHPGLVTVHDVQQENGRPYIVQEYIEGINLHGWMRETAASHEQIVRLLIEIAEAVGFLHQKGYVHRDLKPGNILIDRNGHAHVADFGLAVHESSRWSRAGEVAGTWHYMSPEQLRGETHLLNGRTDVWSLGVILYELLVGKRPFLAQNPLELREQVRIQEPCPPRQLVQNIHPELSRICLKCLQERRADRYESTADLVDDLQHFITAREAGERRLETGGRNSEIGDPRVASVDEGRSDATPSPTRVVPKGLRAFDEHDADFFLELLPGARDRDGLPESIRFWKTRIEEPDPDKTFSVGLIYGPSGCGKSSLVKAGLLPRLSSQVVSVYVEATGDDSEVRLLKGLKKKLPHLPDSDSLPEILQRLRQRGVGGGRKLLIVLDQFEQWLHARGAEGGSQLVNALRHCDGSNLQCVVLVRDDFWMPATRFMRDVESKLIEGHNSVPVDLFPIRHAEEVLTKFGRAFRTLPENLLEQSAEQSAFVQKSVAGLAREGKVICVRLSLFADMMKGKPWTPASLQAVGGTEGVGVTFLEEMFSAATAPPEHRLHQRGARAVLKALLPETGTDIKGGMRSYNQLLEASGYAQRPRDFADLIQILDPELRLITPTDLEGSLKGEEGSVKEEGRSGKGEEGSGKGEECKHNSDLSHFTLLSSDFTLRYYQLTHDYLVPSLREWLTRKQKETRRGRAELRLTERAALWAAKSANRHLPAWWEYLIIVLLAPSRNWTEPQRRMLKAATWHYGMLASCSLVVLFLAAFGLQRFIDKKEGESVSRAVNALQSTNGPGIPFAIRDLEHLARNDVLRELQERFSNREDKRRLPLAYALAHFKQSEIKYLVDAIGTARAEEVDNLVVALKYESNEASRELKLAAANATKAQDWELKTRLATIALHLGDTSIAAEMLQAEPPPKSMNRQPDWEDSPLDPDWKPVSEVAKKSIVAAHGMLEERFAFCLDMPWDAFLSTIELLRPCGYRPTRARPFVCNSQRRVAAIWTRDGRRWNLEHELTAEQLPLGEKPAERNGMLPEDVAAYPTTSQTLSYLLLWCERSAVGEQRGLAVGMTELDLGGIDTRMRVANLPSQKTLQVVLAGDGARRYAGIWSNQGTTATTTPLMESSQLANKSAQDISLAPFGKPTDPLDAMQERLVQIAKLPADQQQAPATRLQRAEALYYLDQPERSLAELDSLPTETSTPSQASTARNIWQYRALNLAKLRKPEESQVAYQQLVKACSPELLSTGFASYTEIIVRGWLGERERAEQKLDTMAAAAVRNADVLYNAACAAAQLARIAAAAEEGEAMRLRQRAFELLRLARAGGYKNLSHLPSDPDLAPLHQEADFGVLITELATDKRYASLFLNESPFDVEIVADLELEQQLVCARQFVAAEYRPWAAVDVVGGDSQILTAFVWKRPRSPEVSWDPVQRTMFIEHFPKWSGDVGKLVNVVRDAKIGSLRSGMCLAIGSQTEATSEAKEAWRDVFSDWYRQQPDSGTHGAAGWALRNWGLQCPEIPLIGPGHGTMDWQLTKSGLTMLRIPAGEFMQQEGTSRVVKVSEFWLADREIARGLFEQFVADKEYPKDQKPLKWDGVAKNVSPTADHPAQSVSWYDAVLFCNWLSWKEGLPLNYRKTGAKEKIGFQGKEQEFDGWEPVPDGRGYRLPTEAEWEYACRASTTTAFTFGDNAKLISNYGVILSSSAEPAGSKLCNGLGLFDMPGNVWEWCWDWHGPYGAKTSVDPQGPSTGGGVRVNRGGSWAYPAEYCRSAYRLGGQPDYRGSYLGFRVALVQSR